MGRLYDRRNSPRTLLLEAMGGGRVVGRRVEGSRVGEGEGGGELKVSLTSLNYQV